MIDIILPWKLKFNLSEEGGQLIYAMDDKIRNLSAEGGMKLGY